MVVIFRVDQTGEVFALLPFEPATTTGYITCYQHVGQHCAADYDWCIATSRPACPREYAPLLKEMKQIGYKALDVRRRRPSKSQFAFVAS